MDIALRVQSLTAIHTKRTLGLKLFYYYWQFKKKKQGLELFYGIMYLLGGGYSLLPIIQPTWCSTGGFWLYFVFLFFGPWSLTFSLLNAGKNLGATLTSFRFGVREPKRGVTCSRVVGSSGTVAGRDLDNCSDGAVWARGRNTSADGDNVVWGTVMGGLGGGNSASVKERALGGSRASRW